MKRSSGSATTGDDDYSEDFGSLIIRFEEGTISYSIFKLYLEYLYCDTLDPSVLTPSVALALSKIADESGDKRLEHLCNIEKRGNSVFSESLTTFRKDIASLIDASNETGRLFADIRFIVYDEKDNVLDDSLYGHRCVLRRAEYYRAMIAFMEKSHGKRVSKVKDMSPQVLRKLLGWIYSQEFEIDHETAVEMLEISVIFNYPQLTQLSEVFLQGKVEESNVVYLLALADEYSLRNLRNKCVNYLVANFVVCSNQAKFDEHWDRLSEKVQARVKKRVRKIQGEESYVIDVKRDLSEARKVAKDVIITAQE